MRDVDVSLDYELLDPSTQGFRTTRWDGPGRLYSGEIDCSLQYEPISDRIRYWVGVEAGAASLDSAARTPALGGPGVDVIEDVGEFSVDTFVFDVGLAFDAGDRAQAFAGYRHSVVEVSLKGQGALEARLATGTLRRDFVFENTFRQTADQFVAGLDIRVWDNVHARLEAAAGGGAESWSASLGYAFGR